MNNQKTYYPKPNEIQKEWIIIDAKGQILGRLASEVAKQIRGKTKANYTPGVDTGNNVIVINVEHIRVTGKKETDKMYYRHSGYPGGLKSINYKSLKEKDPTKALHKAIWGMLPHNRLGRQLIKNLKIYVGSEHPHEAQQPKELVN